MPKTRYPVGLLLLAFLLAPPAFGSAFEQIEKEYGVALDEQPADTCKLNNVAAPCYIPYPPGNVIVPAGTPDSLRQELEKAGLKKKEAPAAARSLEKCAYLAQQNGLFGLDAECKDVLAKARESGELKKRGGVTALAQAYKPEEDGPKIEDQAAIDAMAKTLGAQVRPSARCTSIGRCFDVCKDGRFYGVATLVSGGLVDHLKTKVQTNLGSRSTGPCPSKDDKPELEAAKKACPAADPKRSPRDLAELIAKKKANSPETGNLSAADFLMICASQDTGKDLASLGMTRDKAQALMDLVKPKDIKAADTVYGTPAERQQLDAACKAAGGKGDSCARLQRFSQIDDLGKACKAGDPGACEKQSKLVVQEEMDRHPDVKKKVARAKAYGADTDQAARYDGYIQRHFKDPKQQDLMERMMRANPETMGKLMEQNTQCEKTKNAAACDHKFYTNYLGLANGHPVSDVGKRYLANMCAMPENKDVEACKHAASYQIKKRRTSVPDPVTAPVKARRSTSDSASLFGGLFGNLRGKSRYLKGTNLPCTNVTDPDTECDWR